LLFNEGSGPELAERQTKTNGPKGNFLGASWFAGLNTFKPKGSPLNPKYNYFKQVASNHPLIVLHIF
jgi:hypothetical protein